MSELTPDLRRLGDALECAATANLARSAPRERRVRSRRLALALAAAVVVPGGALAAERLTSGQEVADSMPAGAAIFAGRHPSCSAVRPGVEYRCVLDGRPAPEVTDFRGTVEPTVGADQRVNGGCRGLDADGLTWQCYLGEEAVRQHIVDDGFLGQRVSGPGHG